MMKYMAEIFTLFAQLPEDKKEIAIREAQRMLKEHEKSTAPDGQALLTASTRRAG